MPSRYKSDLLHSQTFTNSRLHFLKWWIRLPPKWRPFFKIACVTRRAFASILDVLDRAVRSSWLVDHSRTLRHFLTSCTIHVISVDSEFRWGKRYAHKTKIRPQTSSRNQVASVVNTARQLIPWIASDRLCCLLHVVLTTTASSYRKMKCFVTQSCRTGNLDPLVADSSYARI